MKPGAAAAMAPHARLFTSVPSESRGERSAKGRIVRKEGTPKRASEPLDTVLTILGPALAKWKNEAVTRASRVVQAIEAFLLRRSGNACIHGTYRAHGTLFD